MKKARIGKKAQPEEPLNIGSQRIELSDDFLRKKAKEALTKAKELEKQQIANGATWVVASNRTRILKK